VLVFPYYTVQSSAATRGTPTFPSCNTTDSQGGEGSRLEGKTSAEVLDFNLFLSPNDVWTAAIIPSDNRDFARPHRRRGQVVHAPGDPATGSLP
jgi:hypothetical protein